MESKLNRNTKDEKFINIYIDSCDCWIHGILQGGACENAVGR